MPMLRYVKINAECFRICLIGIIVIYSDNYLSFIKQKKNYSICNNFWIVNVCVGIFKWYCLKLNK